MWIPKNTHKQTLHEDPAELCGLLEISPMADLLSLIATGESQSLQLSWGAYEAVDMANLVNGTDLDKPRSLAKSVTVE